MDIKGLRTLTLVGTILFGIFGVFNTFTYFLYLSWFTITPTESPFGEYRALCFVALICWVIIIAFLTYMLYQNTVLGLDRGNYMVAKRWMVIGAICGFIFGGGVSVGLITVLIFIIAYVMTDDAVRSMYYYPPPGYYPYPPPPLYGPYTLPSQYSTPDIKLKNINIKNLCPKCGQYIDGTYATCPYCHEKLR